ncbi:peptidoglycan DD-metalloendopeptidase family protein [Klebsiella pneumoniae]|nr:peptidoglycan DD-metalloendopeptidase family protein [Klebsiella pneumoniae]
MVGAVVAKRSGAAGYYVAIRHGCTYTTRYMHLRKLLVKPGQKVKRGDRIALSGNTGRSNMPHLHLRSVDQPAGGQPVTC